MKAGNKEITDYGLVIIVIVKMIKIIQIRKYNQEATMCDWEPGFNGSTPEFSWKPWLDCNTNCFHLHKIILEFELCTTSQQQKTFLVMDIFQNYL